MAATSWPSKAFKIAKARSSITFALPRLTGQQLLLGGWRGVLNAAPRPPPIPSVALAKLRTLTQARLSLLDLVPVLIPMGTDALTGKRHGATRADASRCGGASHRRHQRTDPATWISSDAGKCGSDASSRVNLLGPGSRSAHKLNNGTIAAGIGTAGRA